MSSFNELIAQYIISSWVLVNLFSTVEPKFKISTVKATLYPKKIVETVTETRSKRKKYPKTKNKGRRKKKKKMPSSTFSGTVSTPKLSVAVDMGNPFLNLTVDAFLKIGAVGITKSLAEDTYKAIDKGSLSKSTLENALKKLCKEGVYWGAAGGVYIGTEYGIERIRGSRDWKNAMLAGAATGAVLSAVGKKGKDTIVIDAILGGALATASQFINNHYFY